MTANADPPAPQRADLAERVLLPGDPHRALAVAQALLEEPRMFNHARGLWGYTGAAPDGEPLTVQSTGMGGPSAAIVIEELIGLGARRLIRIGTCGALAEGLELGELVVAREVLAADGTSAALGATAPLRPDPGLSAALGLAGAAPGDGGVHRPLLRRRARTSSATGSARAARWSRWRRPRCWRSPRAGAPEPRCCCA